jgi:membrane protease YdiL (CAAX protease family)
MSFSQKIKNIVFAYGGSILSVVFFILVLKRYAPRYLYQLGPTQSQQIFAACVVAPLIEEVIFRLLPIQIARRIFAEKFEDFKYYFVVLLAVIFGGMHGWIGNVFIQGVGGVFLGWVYIRNGYSYWSSVTVHALWNFMLMVGLPALYGA